MWVCCCSLLKNPKQGEIQEKGPVHHYAAEIYEYQNMTKTEIQNWHGLNSVCTIPAWLTQGQVMCSESSRSLIPQSMFANYICNYKHGKDVLLQCIPLEEGIFFLTNIHIQQNSPQSAS